MDGIETFRELKPNRLTQRVINYITETVSLFPVSSEFEKILSKKKNENQHSKAFCVFMTNYCKAKYNFQGENAQKGSYTIDIGVYKGDALVFVIEAKLLPTPKIKKKNPRNEYEYVYGKGAGIQRFKDGNHGVDNTDLPFWDSGMIAFVKENSFEYWFEKVNNWISDAKWKTSEQLQIVKIEKTAVLLSAHSRQDDTMIRLHHFWIFV